MPKKNNFARTTGQLIREAAAYCDTGIMGINFAGIISVQLIREIKREV